MTPEQQRIKIAEVCGWKPDPDTGLWYGLCSDIAGFRDGVIAPLPDYLNDLNAMHIAEKRLHDLRHVWDRYCDLLGGSLYHCAHATAAKRAEAFLRTLNLWTE